MRCDRDFYQQLNDNFRLTSILVIYRLPDYHSILQEFFWQALDHPPTYPRMTKFINHWIENIEAPIHAIKIANTEIISPTNFECIANYYEFKRD